MSNLSATLVIAAFTSGIATFGCGTPSVFSGVKAIEVTLVPREGPANTPKSVDPQALEPWATCLGTTRAIGVDEAWKMVLEEGEYRLDVTDTHGPRRFVLHNTGDLTGPGGDFYRNECVHALVTAFLGTAAPTP